MGSRYTTQGMRLEVFLVVTTKITIIWDVMLYNL
jgi:hypothetical protein